MTLSEKARLFATAAHGATGQKRKYTGAPYIQHPIMVANIVYVYGGDEAMIAAAYLHDVVEDTAIELETIRAHFGEDVATLVEMLTDISTPADGNRAARKAIDLAHTAKASPRAKTIKLADLLHNTSSIVKHDPDFAKVYLVEKAALLEVLREGDNLLWAHAAKTVTLPTSN